MHDVEQAVSGAVAGTPDERLREISLALVSHLHEFMREVGLTQREWEEGIAFLTATGHACIGGRQEFVLLSDTLGVSSQVDAIAHGDPAATDSTVLSPFYIKEAPERPLGSNLSEDLPGLPMYVSGSVLSTDGTPVAGAAVDVWHSGDDGFYDVQRDGSGSTARSRARLFTDAQGRFDFWSIKPSAYPIPHDGPVGRMLAAQGRHPWRPAHVHFLISAKGFERLITQLFVAGDVYLESDVAFGVRESLIRPIEEKPAGAAPHQPRLDRPWCHLHNDFRLVPSAV